MSRFLVSCLLVLVGCSSPGSSPSSTSLATTSTPRATTSTSLATTTTAAADPVDRGDLPAETVVTTVFLDDRPLDVVVVSTPEDRSRGLRGVSDLGSLDGMLFSWGGEMVASRFTMADTLIPLDIAFFDQDGRFVDALTMVPCLAAPCPSYAAQAPYAYALESPAGSLPEVGPESMLSFPG